MESPILEWLLLGFGLSQLPLPAPLAVAGWFLALSWRKSQEELTPLAHDLLRLLLVVWTFLFVACLHGAVHQGLLLRPDMQVAGNRSHDTLRR